MNNTISTDPIAPRGSVTHVALGRWALVAAMMIVLSGGVAAGASAHHPRPRSQASPVNRDGQPRGKLVFSAGFPGTTLNSAIWNTCYPWARDPAIGCHNFGNPTEYEWYMPSQVSVSNGTLNLLAQNLPTTGQDSTGAPMQYVCRSGMATTYPGFHFQYGYIRVVARFPDTVGLWSALWLAPANWQFPPEIDMVEYWVRKVKPVGLYLHGDGGFLLKAHPHVNLSEGWHTYALDWTPTEISWYIDNRQVLSTRTDIPDQPMYFLATLAYSSAKPSLVSTGSGCHGVLQIKSVQVWKQ